ncbi:hypothetical protein [Yeosuana marina]|uniref:hypothetical protein n=1 Tax=Yeosuana marina TaxID=1565536 RepID=UPI0030C84859
MNRKFRYLILSFIVIAKSVLSCKQEKDISKLSKNVPTETKQTELNPDEEKIKTTINELLFNAGNYNVLVYSQNTYYISKLGYPIGYP